jgi:hypothetical protein
VSAAAAINGGGATERAAGHAPASPAARSRAYRARKRAERDAITTTPTTTAPVTPMSVPASAEVITPGARDATPVITFGAALAVASVSGAFSVMGMTHVFSGATLAVMAMAGCMEFAKIAATMWLARADAAPLALKAAVVALVIALIAITTIGVFGFLAAAHVTQVVTGEAKLGARYAEVAGRIRVQAGILADIDKRIGQVDAAVAEATRRGRTTAAMAIVAQQEKRRGELLADRTREANKLATLQVEAAGVAGERQKLAADSGPVRYLAELIRVDQETLTPWFILLVAALLDPLAVTLLFAAAVARRR